MEANVNTQKVSGEKPSLFGMITSPSLQFERMKSSNAVWGAFWIMALLTGIVGAIGGYVNSQTPEAIKANQQLGLEVSPGVSAGYGFALVFFGSIIGFFIIAAVYKVLMMLMGNDTTYKKLLTIIVYTGIISVIGGLINALLALVFDGNGKEMYTSLGPLFASSGGVVHGIAKSIEIFGIWGLVVTGLGLQITAGLSKKQATIIVVVFFIISLAFGAIGGLVSGLVPKV
ncbi:Yip1 family protein [Bacillus cereus group sp. BfR-BA-01380]|uniref:Yip1 family protein n=1 Tax=Bacillus cereus group sp. BfR-BA-01380 TaxID=2920324 RepID=UPI001F57FD21|nr:Yip1 family protein [Bacillus cereus group sp. BfR-BA-01380]